MRSIFKEWFNNRRGKGEGFREVKPHDWEKTPISFEADFDAFRDKYRAISKFIHPDAFAGQVKELEGKTDSSFFKRLLASSEELFKEASNLNDLADEMKKNGGESITKVIRGIETIVTIHYLLQSLDDLERRVDNLKQKVEAKKKEIGMKAAAAEIEAKETKEREASVARCKNIEELIEVVRPLDYIPAPGRDRGYFESTRLVLRSIRLGKDRVLDRDISDLPEEITEDWRHFPKDIPEDYGIRKKYLELLNGFMQETKEKVAKKRIAGLAACDDIGLLCNRMMGYFPEGSEKRRIVDGAVDRIKGLMEFVHKASLDQLSESFKNHPELADLPKDYNFNEQAAKLMDVRREIRIKELADEARAKEEAEARERESRAKEEMRSEIAGCQNLEDLGEILKKWERNQKDNEGRWGMSADDIIGKFEYILGKITENSSKVPEDLGTYSKLLEITQEDGIRAKTLELLLESRGRIRDVLGIKKAKGEIAIEPLPKETVLKSESASMTEEQVELVQDFSQDSDDAKKEGPETIQQLPASSSGKESEKADKKGLSIGKEPEAESPSGIVSGIAATSKSGEEDLPKASAGEDMGAVSDLSELEKEWLAAEAAKAVDTSGKFDLAQVFSEALKDAEELKKVRESLLDKTISPENLEKLCLLSEKLVQRMENEIDFSGFSEEEKESFLKENLEIFFSQLDLENYTMDKKESKELSEYLTGYVLNRPES